MHRIFERLQRPLDESMPVFVDTANQQEVMELNERFYDMEIPMTAVSLDMGRKAVKAGIDRMAFMMGPDDELLYPDVSGRVGVYGSPNLLFFDNLASDFVTRRGESLVGTSRHLWEMSRWQWKEAREGQLEKDEPDDYTADGAHCMAALRYGLMARMGPIEEPSRQYPVATGIYGDIMRQLMGR